MPVINRFRVVNFRYDDDKKYISNELFEFWGQNSLINLENGGGKSVILQLALQALIPGAELSGRKFVDYFKVNSGTVHILIEWLLDSTTTEYLLTGICASRDSEGLRFFTYTHAYNSQNECDIKRIPVVNSKKQVAGYSEFYKFLRGMISEYRINTYSKDRMGDYRKKLTENSLFREEYDAIVQINQSEGGIEKFFERAKKSRNVIERLIIPAIPSLAGEEQNLLAGTFRKHLENLKSIPLLQYNINVYRSFLERGKALLELLDKYQGTMETSAEFRLQIRIFENIMIVVAQRAAGELQKLENDRTELKLTEGELNYKLDSLEVFHKEQKKLKHEDEQRMLATNIEIEKLRHADTEGRIKYANSVNSWLELKEQRKRHLELNEKLKVMDAEEGELQKEYQDYIFALSELLAGEIEKLKGIIETCIEQEKETVASQKATKEQINEKRKLKESASNNLAVKRADKERAEKESDRCAARFNVRELTLLLNPETALNTFEGELQFLEKEKVKLEEGLKSLMSREEDARIKIGNLRAEKSTLAERCAAKQGILQEYEKKLNSIKNQMEAMGIKDDLYTGAAEAKLNAIEEKAAFDLAAAQVNHNSIENKKLLLGDLDYFLPDRDVLSVFKYLEENGVTCMPGSLWLKKQPSEKREKLLNNNPLLPYSIIIEASMLDKVKAHSIALSKLAENYPVAIIPGNSGGLDYSVEVIEGNDLQDKKETALDIIMGSEIYLLSSGSKGLLISEKELEAFKEGLDKKLGREQERTVSLKEDHLRIIGLKERIFGFLEEHSLSWRNQLLDEIGQLRDKGAYLEKESDKLCREQEELLRARKNNDNNLLDISAKLADTREDIAQIKDYIKARTEIVEASKEINVLGAELKGRDEEICLLENSLEQLNSKLMKFQEEKNGLSKEKERLNRRLQKIRNQLAIESASKHIPGTVEELEAHIAAINEKRMVAERDAILGMLESMKGFIDKYKKAIRANGFSETDFETIFEGIPENEISDLEESERNIKKTLKEMEDKWRSAENEINNLKGGIDELSKAISKKYGKDRYEFGNGESIEADFYEERKKELEAKLRKLDVKIKESMMRNSEVEKQLGLVQQFIEDNRIEKPAGFQGDMLQLEGFEENMGLWDLMKMKAGEIAVLFRKYKDRFKRNESEAEENRIKVEKNFDELYSNDEWKDNSTVKRILSGIMKENLYDLQYMHELFGRLFESVRRMQEAETLQLEECKRNKSELVERCLQRAQTVYEELKLVDSFSKTKIGGQALKIVKIEMPKLEEEQGRAMMTLYLEKCIEEISRLKEERNYDPARIDGTIMGYMAPQVLLDAVINLNDISISVYKPEHNMELSQYIPWEVVIQWSGGEKLAGFFAMFISIVSYLRFKKTGWQGSKKVIWIDNPFGQANAGHLLEYIFELAKSTNTQMICLTGLQETNIYAQFDVVYSLVHRMLSSMSIIQSKQIKAGQSIEVGYYNLKSEQMSLF